MENTAADIVHPALLQHSLSQSSYQIIYGDCREQLQAFPYQADLIVTSPPYADARQTHYGGIDPRYYADWFMSFHEVFWQALKPEGSLVLNMKDKIVQGVRQHYVWETIAKLTSLGWYCIDDYIWHKKTSMPGYWPTRLRDAWEYVFHLAKVKKPYVNQEAVKIPIALATQKRIARIDEVKNTLIHSATGSRFRRNLANWSHKKEVLPNNVLYLCPENRNQGHPAAFPVGLPRFFIQLLSKPHDLIIDPFAGSGTTGLAALALQRRCFLIDNHLAYCHVAEQRLSNSMREKCRPNNYKKR
jgi:site-specific DNA-methyltransferase (adenine-specific)